MKKAFIVLSVMAALMFSVAPSQALLGMPDDVPGKDVVFPFLASMPGQGNINTLLVLTDVYGSWPLTAKGTAGKQFHYTVYTKRSDTVYNDNLTGTPYDVIAVDAYSIIAKMAPTEAAKLAIDLNGDGTKDHYAGYIYFEGLNLTNTTIGQFMINNIPAGVAAASNAAVKEYNPNAVCPSLIDGNGNEVFSADALANAKALQIGAPHINASWFALYPRYYINDADTGKTYLFIWKSTNAPSAPLHVWFFNADENYVSSNIPLPDELNIIDIEQYLPVTLHSGYPKEGWIRILVPDINGAGFDATREWLGYTWIAAYGSAAESWNILTPMHRDAY